MSTKCSIRIRHQAEKRRGPDRQNNGMADVQMITCRQDEHPKEKVVQEMVDLLAITRS